MQKMIEKEFMEWLQHPPLARRHAEMISPVSGSIKKGWGDKLIDALLKVCNFRVQERCIVKPTDIVSDQTIHRRENDVWYWWILNFLAIVEPGIGAPSAVHNKGLESRV